MTEGGLESAISLTAGTGNAGAIKEASVTPAMTEATRTDIATPPAPMTNDDGLCTAAEQKEVVKVTAEGSVGVSADLTTESTGKDTVEATVGAVARATADSTPGVVQKYPRPSPKKVANKSSKRVKQNLYRNDAVCNEKKS